MQYFSSATDFFYTSSADTLDYYITVDAEEAPIFQGKAVKNPQNGVLSINVARIVRDWLDTNMPDFRDFDGVLVPHPKQLREFYLYSDNRTLLEEYTVLMEYTRGWAGRKELDAEPVNGRSDPRQKIFIGNINYEWGKNWYMILCEDTVHYDFHESGEKRWYICDTNIPYGNDSIFNFIGAGWYPDATEMFEPYTVSGETRIQHFFRSQNGDGFRAMLKTNPLSDPRQVVCQYYLLDSYGGSTNYSRPLDVIYFEQSAVDTGGDFRYIKGEGQRDIRIDPVYARGIMVAIPQDGETVTLGFRTLNPQTIRFDIYLNDVFERSITAASDYKENTGVNISGVTVWYYSGSTDVVISANTTDGPYERRVYAYIDDTLVNDSFFIGQPGILPQEYTRGSAVSGTQYEYKYYFCSGYVDEEPKSASVVYFTTDAEAQNNGYPIAGGYYNGVSGISINGGIVFNEEREWTITYLETINSGDGKDIITKFVSKDVLTDGLIAPYLSSYGDYDLLDYTGRNMRFKEIYVPRALYIGDISPDHSTPYYYQSSVTIDDINIWSCVYMLESSLQGFKGITELYLPNIIWLSYDAVYDMPDLQRVTLGRRLRFFGYKYNTNGRLPQGVDFYYMGTRSDFQNTVIFAPLGTYHCTDGDYTVS